MYFQYKEEYGRDVLYFKSDNGNDVECLLDAGICNAVYVDCVEFLADEDIKYGVFLLIKASFTNIAAIMKEAESYWDFIKDEIASECAADVDYRQELSSPKQTGRI